MTGYSETLRQLKEHGNFRRIPPVDDRSECIDLSLNDYLGLAGRADLQADFFSKEENRRLALTSSASRLLASDQEQYYLLENRLKELYDSREALLFNSGYHANTGLISALASEKGTLVIADRLIHASIIDGIILSRAPFIRFPHNDVTRLEDILEKEHGRHERIIIAVESVYSMDGDRCPIDALIRLKKQYGNIILYIDEAHAFGAIGRQGLGLCREHKDFKKIDVIIGTFGKACASSGAFAIMDSELKDYAINRSRSFIFSTAIPPVNCAWTRFMIDNIVQMDSQRQHLAKLGSRLCEGIRLDDTRYIIPVIAGSADKAIKMSGRLRTMGFKVLPIRTPTVPPGTERLRISLNASLDLGIIDRLLSCIHEIQETI